jgi:LmbE family N-acetylglucosaminyl deacetylase
MKLRNPNSSIYIPDGQPVEEALRRITHLGIGAHQDDLEIMAYHGIQACYLQKDKCFGGITCTDGRGSSRIGPYADYSDEQMAAVRIDEQKKAACVGGYGAMLQLGYPSKVVKDPKDTTLRDELAALLRLMKPEVIYTHNPADKHDTHIGVVIPVLQALRQLPKEQRPKRVLGCEVWRNLDWMQDEDKVALDVSAREGLFAALVGVFDSQVAGGKRYDLATLGRAKANATYFASHATDQATGLWYAMDLTPLAQDDQLDIVEYVHGYIRKFCNDVQSKLSKRLGRPLPA